MDCWVIIPMKSLANGKSRLSAILGAELGWDVAVQASEIARFVTSSAVEFAVPPGSSGDGDPAVEPTPPGAALSRDT